MPSLSETDSDRGEGMEEGNQSLPALARNQSIIRTEPRRPGMPEPESFVVDGDEDLEGPEASVASRSLSR